MSGKIIVQKRLTGPAPSIEEASIKDLGECIAATKNRNLAY